MNFQKLASVALLVFAAASPALADNQAAFNRVDNGSAACLEKNYQAQYYGDSDLSLMGARHFVDASQNVYVIIWEKGKCVEQYLGFIGDGTIYIEGDSLAFYTKTQMPDNGEDRQNGLQRREKLSAQEHVNRSGYFFGYGASALTPYTDGNEKPKQDTRQWY